MVFCHKQDMVKIMGFNIIFNSKFYFLLLSLPFSIIRFIGNFSFLLEIYLFCRTVLVPLVGNILGYFGCGILAVSLNILQSREKVKVRHANL